MKKFNDGQSFFEVVVALAVVAMILVALVALASVSIRNSTFSRNKTVASRYTQEVSEWLRGERDADWSAFYTRATGTGQTWCFDEEPPAWPSSFGACSSTDLITDTIFTREVILTSLDLSTVETEVKTSWEDSQGVHEVRAVTVLTNWRAEQ